ncbi:hypothetical protein DTO195F2_5712 [Paecilomyces variotii]|nr:hypothetical protein DTO195F2_5712 [Paecilomyces variotii]
MARLYGVMAREALHTAAIHYHEKSRTLTPPNNYNGWVNPEDLPAMPQCIAQQNQSAWLNAITECTAKQCTSYFGFICTHQQWLTELCCLTIAFPSDVLESYLPYCGRSVLAKAQLYLWIWNVTGRTWLVDVGDANGLQNLSPASLAEGYADLSVIYNAPSCLTGSVSAQSMERFQHVVASCMFTGTTQHTGNAARPWEYSEFLQSMIALDFETVGYDLTRYSIRDGDYIDKECFCNAFTVDPKSEPCLGSGQMDLTKERLWMNATCGSMSLPGNWTDKLKTTEFAYIPIEDWHWPMCVADMPKQVIELPDQCATDACEIDSDGYCKVKRAVDRACFCRDISYDSCGGSCQIFETRIDYINWLRDLCGNVKDWHGLPHNWRQLAAPTSLDMIPWRWTVKPSNCSNSAHITRLGYIRPTETCASNGWKLRSFALVNIATFLAAFLSLQKVMRRIARDFPRHSRPWCWLFKGIIITALQLLANWFNAFLVQTTPGYKDVPLFQLMLLWCSIPRPAWLTILLVGVQPFETMNFSAAGSSLCAEVLLQFASSYYMSTTINYGREHNLYLGGMEGAERQGLAKIMYAGALMWLLSISLALAQLVRTTRRMNRLVRFSSLDLLKWQRGKQTIWNIAEELMTQRYARFKENFAPYWVDQCMSSEETPLTKCKGRDDMKYGTFSVESQDHWLSQKLFVELYAATVIYMFFLWIAQWLFWGGFLKLSSEEFCPPRLGVLAAIWIAFSVAGTIVAAT